MQDLRVVAYNTVYHSELLRRSEYARLARAVSSQSASGVNLYRLVGERLVHWGEALQRANAHREAVAYPDRHLRTGEIAAL
jgi:predicted solute-binding protein